MTSGEIRGSRDMRFAARCSVLVCVLLMTAATAGYAAERCDTQAIASHFPMPVEIVEQESIVEIERKNMVRIKVDGGEKVVPFGYDNHLWEELKALYEEGDCIAFFKSAPETWRGLGGFQGYLLAREGAPIYAVITKLS